MPIYSYCCRKCGTEFDKLRPMSQRNEPAECPHCASEEVDRGVEEFGVETFAGGRWQEVAAGTTIGSKRLLRLPEQNAQKIRISIRKAKACPTIATIGLYLAPPL